MTEPLSAHEEELLRAYSRTLADNYWRWKDEGAALPKAVERLLFQWREQLGAPAENSDAHSDAHSDADSHARGQGGHSSDEGATSAAADATAASAESAASTKSGPSAQPDAGGQSSARQATAGQNSLVLASPTATGPVLTGGLSPTGRAGAAPSAPSAQGEQAHSADTLAPGLPGTSPLLRESPRSVTGKGKAAKAEKTAQQGQLPGISVPRTPGETAPMSNYLARTSLFAPIRKGRRVMHDKQKLHSPEGIEAFYTGKQLDMADQDVYLTALRLAGGIKAGDRILINRAAFLRMLGYKHNPGARDYKWLEESFYRIATGRVIIKAKHIEANLPLMGALLTDTRSGDYYFTIPRETYALWAKNLYSYIDLEKRHALERNVPLSKWLQSYAQSHAPGTHTISMDLLHLWCGYGGRLRDFRDSLTGALDELTRVGILASWSVQERGKGRQKKIMISWVRERTHRDDAPAPALNEDTL